MIEKDLEIIDDFLDQDYFDNLKKDIESNNFPWAFQRDVAIADEDLDNQFYFVHRLYENFVPESSFFDHIRPLTDELGAVAIIRARILMYVNQGTQYVHQRHIDKPYPHTAALLYINECNGFTEFDDGTRVDNKENRLVRFDGSILHSSSTCTDQKNRLVLSINYF